MTEGYGGGIWIYSDCQVAISGGEISNNQALRGGGIYSESAITIDNLLVSGNIAREDGGGLLITEKLTINSGEFKGNSAADNGGAIYTTPYSYADPLNMGYENLTINPGVIFTDNKAKSISDAPTEITVPLNFSSTLLNNDNINYIRPDGVHSVYFDSQGGSKVGNKAIVDGELVPKPVDPSKPGYRFVAWYEDKGFATLWNFSNQVNADITLYAKWQKINYPEVVDKSKLQALVDAANDLDGSLYTADSWEAVQTRVNEAQTILDKSNTTQTEINQMLEKLRTAIDSLVTLEQSQVLYRLYNPNTGEHLYTLSRDEWSHLITLGWQNEGIGWKTPISGASVKRLYNPNTGEHLYTLSPVEYNNLGLLGWVQEGHAFYSDADHSMPIYRLYNANEKAFNHHYTRTISERDWLASLGWIYEGIAFYGVS